MTKWGRDQQDSTIEEVFTILDLDGSGFIDQDEIFRFQDALTGRASQQTAARELARLDANKDGKVSLEEFINGIHH